MRTLSTRKTPFRVILTILLLVGALLSAWALRVEAVGREENTRDDALAAIPVFFTDNLANTTSSPVETPLEQALLKAIGDATTSIDAALYDFDRASVRDALLAAHARGVTVRVVADDEARLSAKSMPTFDALQAAGILVVEDGPVMAAPFAQEQLASAAWDEVAVLDAVAEVAELTATRIMHNKYFILDRARVWTGSVNMSDTDLTLNHNHAMLLEGAPIAAIYQSDFDQMIAGTFGTLKQQTVTKTARVQGVDTAVYFAPQDNPMAQVIAEIDRAQTSIDFAIFYFTDDGVRDALLRAFARGVRVRGIWDHLGSTNAYADDEALCDAGIAIKIENTRGLMHHKLLVIDAQGSAPRVLSGSLNWTVGGNDLNNENTLILHDSALAALFAAEFEKMWNGLGDVAPCNPVRAAQWHLYLPIVQDKGVSQPPPAPTAQPIGTPTPQPTVQPTATPIAGPGAGSVEFVRVVYNPEGDDVAGEHVVLMSRLPTPLHLANWMLHDDATNANVYILPDVMLAPHAELTVWVKAGTNSASDLFWGRSSAVWNNDGDVATLRDSAGNFIDDCAWMGGGIEQECLAP